MNNLVRALPLVLVVGCIEYDLTADVEHDDPEASEPPPGGAEGSDTPWPTDTPLGGLRGKICHGLDEGIAGIQVLVEHEWGVARTVTDEEGNYLLDNIPAGEHTLVAAGAEYFFQDRVLVSPNEIVEISHPECIADCDIPIPCIGLAEAMDRGAASIQYQASMGVGAVVVRNLSDDLNICIEDWMVAFSPESQDVMFGPRRSQHLPPWDSASFPYAVDVFGGVGQNAWWCVERWQYTQSGSYYTYNGSLRPSRLMSLVVDRTDLNGSGIEDHVDTVDGQIQTQHNIWNEEAAHPIFLVGRKSSLVQLSGPSQRRPIELQVRNLGQRWGTGRVQEIIPPGFNVTEVDPPAQVSTLSDGSTRLTWEVSLEGADPDFSYVRPTIYDDEVLRYTLSLGEDPCEGRCEASGASVDWTDRVGRPWNSASEPLIIEHCVPEVTR